MIPTGTVTFLFTDIENSSTLWDRHPALMEPSLHRHDELLRTAFDRWNGYVFATGGDGYGVAFRSATDAIEAAVAAQQGIVAEPWPAEAVIRVRIGLHTGTAEERDGDYFGATVSRAARIASAARATQIVVSAATAALIADGQWTCIDQGSHALRGFRRPESLFSVVAPGVDLVELPLRTDRDVPGSLPDLRVGLVGRETELKRLAAALGSESLVTLVGVGGVGKTTVALSAAQAASGGFADGAWLVELGELTSPDDVGSAVAAELHLRLPSGADVGQLIAAALGRQHRLLVLDNCEHVIDAVAQLVETIVAHCPSVVILATSRELLGLDGECAIAVGPLPIEASTGRSEAAQLFCARVEGHLGAFQPDADQLAIVDEICRRLDGLPLAIELAAARMPAFGLPELLQRLNDRFGLLTRRRGAVDRHRSLRTTVAWSYDLLTADEQLVFDRLSVFTGDFDIAAADAVCGLEPLVGSVAQHVAALVERSLLNVDRGSIDTRYQMLETVRQYGEEQLAARGETEVVVGRHLAHFVAWVEAADAGIRGRDEGLWHHRFEADWHNVRRAVGSAVERNDGDAACHLIWHVHRWASTRVRLETGEWANQVSALDSVVDHPLRPIVLASAAHFAHQKADWVSAHAGIELAVDEERRIGEAVEPWVLDEWCLVKIGEGVAAGRRQVEALRRRAGDDPFWNVYVARRETVLVWMQMTSEDPTESEADDLLAISRAAVRQAEAFGNPGLIAFVVGSLGSAQERRDPSAALPLLERAISIASDVGADGVVASLTPDLAYVLAKVGRPVEALTLIEPSMRRNVRSGAWSNFLLSLVGCLQPLSDLGRCEEVALAIGCTDEVFETVRDLQTSLIPPELRAMATDTLGAHEAARLIADGRLLTLPDLADGLLAAIDDVLANAEK